jgi:hypothetical protein
MRQQGMFDPARLVFIDEPPRRRAFAPPSFARAFSDDLLARLNKTLACFRNANVNSDPISGEG